MIGTPRLGLPRAHHRVTDSTNERAKALAELGAPHGTLVTAAEQTAGRGRQGRSWEAAPGAALLASLLLRGIQRRHAVLPLAAAVAVCEACEAMAPVSCEIKWPNDVWIERRKVAGILVEGRPQEGWAVLGAGINIVAPPAGKIAATATSLALDPAAGEAGERLLAALLEALERRVRQAPARVLGAWRRRDGLRGHTVRFRDAEGVAAGIDDDGSLLVDTEAGRLALDAGEVHLAPATPGS